MVMILLLEFLIIDYVECLIIMVCFECVFMWWKVVLNVGFFGYGVCNSN